MNLSKLVLIISLILPALTIKANVREPFKGGMIITEWDLAFPSEEHMDQYFAPLHNKGTSLIVAKKGIDSYDIWNKKDALNLTYCVSDEFKGNKKDVVEALKVSTEDWMAIANVNFIYKSSEDAKCNGRNKNVVFDVRPVDIGMYIARAFFPSYPRTNRNVLIDSSAFDYSFVAMSGFLRHELGHVLGFRHEHISPKGNQECQEHGDFFALTPYDQMSVMHYPQCGGKNNIEDLVLSDLDKKGVVKVYPF